MLCYAKKDISDPNPGTCSALNKVVPIGKMQSMHRRLLLSASFAACTAALAPGWAACTFELGRVASNEIQLLPAGLFRATDGRPEKLAGWKMDAAIAARIIAAVAALNRNLVIDYEHQTLHAETNGQPAPAAGWFKTLEWREGKGLFATDVEWTARAKEMIEAGEYKYISPVFTFNPKTGEVGQLQLAALTNYPGLDGMAEVLARAAARFNDDSTSQEKSTMNKLLLAVLAALSLPNTGTEDEAIAGLATLKAKADKTGELETEVAVLKSRAPDPSKYVPIEAMTKLQTDLAALTTQVAGREVDEVVAVALTEGKILPAQEAWARDYGKKDLASLKTYLSTAQPIAALQSTQTKGKGPGASGEDSPEVVAAAALKYQREQAAAGNNISTAQAVDFVSKKT